MAISRGAGTEIIRTAMFEDVNAYTKLIAGEQYHIYTVLSIILFCNARSGTEGGYIALQGYDSKGGTTNQTVNIARVLTAALDTYVWSDKFSFNGYEPVDFASGIDITKQNAIADQGSSVAQELYVTSDSTSTSWDVTVTFIDQNNA